MSWFTSELRENILLTVPRRYFFCGSFMFLFCPVFAMSLCASVYMCFVVTCWERADLLALVCGVCCEFVTFPLVSWIRCGTWLYRFLIFAFLPTLTSLLWLVYQNNNQSVNVSNKFDFNRCYGNKNGRRNRLKTGNWPFWSRFEMFERQINIEHKQIQTKIYFNSWWELSRHTTH